jgi:hypothetical protein
MFYKRIQRIPVMECQSLISLNSLGFISEFEASPSDRPTSQETKFARFYKRIERFPVGPRIPNSLCFISEFNGFCMDDWATRDSKFAWFYKRIQRNTIATVRNGRGAEIVKFAMFYKRIQRIGNRRSDARESLNSLGFISEFRLQIRIRISSPG